MSISDDLISENPSVKLLRDKYEELESCTREITISVTFTWGEDFEPIDSISDVDDAIALAKTSLKREYKDLYKESSLLAKELGLKPQHLFDIVMGVR